MRDPSRTQVHRCREVDQRQPSISTQEDILATAQIVVDDAALVDRVEDRPKLRDMPRPVFGIESGERKLLPIDPLDRERPRVDTSDEGRNTPDTAEPDVGAHLAADLQTSQPANPPATTREVLHDYSFPVDAHD